MSHDESRPAELNAKKTTGRIRDTPYDIFLHAYVIRIILYFYTPHFMCYMLQSKRRLDAYACDMTHPYEPHPYENRGTHTWRGGGLGSCTISKNLMSPTPRRKWYLTTGRRAH